MTSTEPAEHTPDPNSTEPLGSVASITGIVGAALSALIAFGVHIDATQRAALVGLVAAVAPLVVWLWGRRKVYAPATVHQLLAACRRPLTAYAPGRADPDLAALRRQADGHGLANS